MYSLILLICTISKCVTKCRYIVLTAEKLAQDAAVIDNDEDDDDDDEDDEEEVGAAHVAGSSFAPAEDFEHLRDIDEDEDDIDEDDEEVCSRWCCSIPVCVTNDFRSSR